MKKSDQTGELSQVLRLAERRLWTAFEESGIFQHRGLIGTGREMALVSFLNSMMPGRFRAATGEIVDTGGNRSGQTDVLIYDAVETSPLLIQSNGIMMLGAEAVLATIEVKSTMTRAEMGNSAKGLAKTRALRPWGESWARSRGRDEPADAGARFFSTVMAFDTDITTSNWAEKELVRAREEAKLASLPVQHIDRIAVLTRGVLLPADGRAVSHTVDSRVLGTWYSALLHFLTRESPRRQAFPWQDYESWDDRIWETVLHPEFTAPPPPSYSATQKGKYRAQRARR